MVVEKDKKGYGAYVPDMPGCVAAAASRDEVVTLIQEAKEYDFSRAKRGPVVPGSKAKTFLVGVTAQIYKIHHCARTGSGLLRFCFSFVQNHPLGYAATKAG